jgi:hypothetical protein
MFYARLRLCQVRGRPGRGKLRKGFLWCFALLDFATIVWYLSIQNLHELTATGFLGGGFLFLVDVLIHANG